MTTTFYSYLIRIWLIWVYKDASLVFSRSVDKVTVNELFFNFHLYQYTYFCSSKDHRFMHTTITTTRSIQRAQTPPRLWPLTLWCDLDLSSRSRKLMSLDVAYCIVPWYRIGWLWGYRFMRYIYLFISCDLWPSSVTFGFWQGQLHFNH